MDDPNAFSHILARLAACDTCSVANGVDAAGIRMANEGFSDDRIVCRIPTLPPIVGSVVTLKVRSAEPPMDKAFYLDQPDWWERLSAGPKNRVLAIEDLDAHPGRGALVGPVHACLLRAMGFVAVITNGAIRGRHKFVEVGLQAFSSHISPAHAYSHVVELGAPITLAGMPLKPGDLVHGDENGVVTIPYDIAEKVATLAEGFQAREKSICEFCPSPEFSPAGLKQRLATDASRR